jgi:hypothetical protein
MTQATLVAAVLAGCAYQSHERHLTIAPDPVPLTFRLL